MNISTMFQHDPKLFKDRKKKKKIHDLFEFLTKKSRHVEKPRKTPSIHPRLDKFPHDSHRRTRGDSPRVTIFHFRAARYLWPAARPERDESGHRH